MERSEKVKCGAVDLIRPVTRNNIDTAKFYDLGWRCKTGRLDVNDSKNQMPALTIGRTPALAPRIRFADRE